MSGRKRKKARRGRPHQWWESAWLSGLLLGAVAVYVGLSLTGPTRAWWLLLDGGQPFDWFGADNPGGPVGSLINLGLQLVFGQLWCWVIPLLLVGLSLGFLLGRGEHMRHGLLRAWPFWLVTSAWIAQPGGLVPEGEQARWGGLVGYYFARGFHALFGLWGGRIFLTLFLAVTIILVGKPWLRWVPPVLARGAAIFRWVGSCVVDVLRWPGAELVRIARGLIQRRAKRSQPEVGGNDKCKDPPPTAPTKVRVVHSTDEASGAAVPPATVSPSESVVLPGADGENHTAAANERQPSPSAKPRLQPRRKRGPMVLPGVKLLTPGGGIAEQISKEELEKAADKLEHTLHSFGVAGEVKDVRPGPVVTTYEYQPGTGVRVSQIVQRSDDLALAMRARSIRMEAPIPGKAAVGIEIPNPTARMVRLREVIEAAGITSGEPLTVVLGKDVVGRTVQVDLASLPHLLVAGSTGSGKSVCLNALICNLIMRNDPSTLRLVLIDPKMLEMNVYNGIPHLLLPVVTDPQEALKALKWLVAQMEFRYRSLSKWSVRNIKQYNTKVAAGLITDRDGEVVIDPMPYYLCIVDELADLMLQLRNECEEPIARLAQKARAVGIHLILATQRPSVDVLTGVIKANIPCRIAFRVIQRNDSRTILDMNGAEQLLGNGDMLYLQPGRALPVRVHGSFIDVDECEAIAGHWQQYKDRTEEVALVEESSGGGGVTGEDALFGEARAVVVRHQSGSTSLLQRRLRVGYTRAGRLMDMLEEAGVVGPFNGSKAREVYVKQEDLENMNEGEG